MLKLITARSKFILLGLIFLFNFQVVNAQLSVTSGYTPQQLAETLAGPNIQVFNASYTGDPSQKGIYTYAGSAIQTTGGVILSTGLVIDALGPNNDGGTSTGGLGTGDQTLSDLAGFTTNDAVELKFDFEVQSDEISFDFIFGSEEYNEWVNTSFNDVFAFYISGPGIIGEENLAVVPTTTDPVTINTINLGSYWQLYVNNEFGATTNDIEFDGYTKLMKAQKSGLLPCGIYTLRLVIADGSDSSFDSGVFLQENSLVQGTVDVVSTTPTVDNTALEGCIQASFTFNLDQPLSENYVIPFDIGGSAINGVDYATIDNQLVIPAGQTSATIFIDAFEDGLVEGQETIYLVYSPTPCAPKDTIELFIDDMQPIDFNLLGTDLSCKGDNSGEIDATITGGTAPYSLIFTTPDNEQIAIQSTDLPLTGLAAGTYLVDIDDAYGCQGEAIVVSGEYNGGPTFLPDGNGQVYTSVIPISGFDGATLNTPDQLQSICLNMEHSSLGEVEIQLIAPDGTILILKERFSNNDGGHTDLGEPVAKGPVDGGNPDITPGIGYDYCFTANPFYSTMVNEQSNYYHQYTDVTGRDLQDRYLPSGSYTSYQAFENLIGVPLDGDWTLWVKDHNPQDNGYIFSWNLSVLTPNNGDSITLLEPVGLTITEATTSPDCSTNNGSIDITVTGDNGPFTFSWNNGATTEDLTGIAAGVYTVQVTDLNGCTQSQSFTVSNAVGSSLSAAVTNETCVSANNGSIDLSATGSIASVNWSNGATTEDLSGLSPGTYSVTVQTSDGCISTASYQISAAIPMILSSTITNERCGDMEGIIDLSVSGGQQPYTFSWSNGAIVEDATDLQQGTYMVTVTDANGCQKQGTYNIINLVGQCAPNCDLSIDFSEVTDEYCGNQNGAVVINASSSNSPISIAWSNGSSATSIGSLAAGNYSVTLTDIEGCIVEQSYTVINNTYGLQVANVSVVNETCGNSLGSISYTVSGGLAPYTFAWNTGATSQNLTNLSAGSYTVTITDANGCSLVRNFTITNSTPFTLSYQNVVNANCGGNGSIDINVSPVDTYSYLWSNGMTSQDLISVPAGTYSCLITNTGTGCQLTTPVYTIQNQSGSLVASIVDTDDEICGNGQGEILLTVSGGAPSYSFIWSNGATTQNISSLSAGTYSCTINDQNGCAVNLNNIVISNLPGTLSATATPIPDTCSQMVGELALSISGGVSPYDIIWSNGGTTAEIVSLSAGTYTYTVTDLNGCVFNGSKVVQNVSGNLAATTSTTNPDCGSANGAIDLTVYNNAGALSYTWSNGASSEDLSGLTAGNYNVTITDVDGCQLVQNVSLGGILTIVDTLVVPENCGFNNGQIQLIISGGSSPQYTWSNGATGGTISNLNSGSYSVNITTFEGCQTSGSFNVPETFNCESMCSASSTTEATGSLFDSGGSGGNYGPNQNCSYLISPACNSGITIDFAQFQLSGTGDRIYIYDGTTAAAPLLVSLTGGQTPGQYVATSGNAFIRFTSDGTLQGPGFMLNWVTDEITAPPIASISASNVNPAFGEIVTFTNTSINSETSSWDLDGDLLEDANSTTTSYTYTTPGLHTVTLVTTNCIGSDTVELIIDVQNPPTIALNDGNGTYNVSDCNEHFYDSVWVVNTGGGDLNFTASSGLYDLNPTMGIVNVGDSVLVVIDVTPNATMGNISSFVYFSSNDPASPLDSVQIVVNQAFSCTEFMCTQTESTTMQGTISDSGGDANPYMDDESCTYLINPPCVSQIDLTFSSFDVEQDFDNLFVYDGIDDTAPLIAVLTGNTIPGTLSAYSGAMFLKFESDFSITMDGFVANWVATVQTNLPTAAANVSNTTPTVGETVNFFNTSLGVDQFWWDTNGDGLADETSQLMSQVYNTPGVYEVVLFAENCIGLDSLIFSITVTSPPNIAVNLVEGNSMSVTSCISDTLSFYIVNNAIPGSGNLFWNASNLMPNAGTISAGDSMLVNFIYNPGPSSGVFNQNIFIFSNDPDQGTFTQAVTITQQVFCSSYTMCGINESNELSGVIYDSGFTNNYSDDEDCGFLINPGCGTQIDLVFSSFNIENNFDNLYIYDGVDASGTLLATLTGSFLPGTISASSGAMFLHFVSDFSISAEGFKATWSTVQPGPVNASFNVSNLFPSAGQTVNFTNTSTNGTEFYWDFGDGGSSTLENPSHSYASNGVYSVMLTVSNCIYADSFMVEINVGNVGLAMAPNHSLNIYPNPSRNGKFTLSGVEMDEKIEVVDQLGKKVNVQITNSDADEKEVHLEQHPPGIYYLNYKGKTYKLIK